MKYILFIFPIIISIQYSQVKCNKNIELASYFFSIGNLDSAKIFADFAFNEINNHTPDTTKKSIYFRLYEINIELSRLDSALIFARLDSAITERIYGIDSYQFAVSLLNISTVFVQKLDFRNANSLLDRSTKILESTIGTDNEYYAQLLENQALILMSQFNLTTAESLLNQSLELRLKHLGSEHIDYSSSLHNLATIYYLKQQFEKASELFNKSLEIKRIKLGESHPRYSNTLHNLGALYFLRGKLKEAMELFQKAEASYRLSLGEISLPYAKLIANIGTMFYQKGEYDYSESLLLKSLEIYDKLELNKSSEYITILTNLSQLYILKGKFFSAEHLLTKLIEVQASNEEYIVRLNHREIHIENSLNYQKPSNQFLLLFNDLAALYIYQGRLNEAKNALNFVIANYNTHTNRDSSDYAAILTQLANVSSYIGDLDNAVKYFDNAIQILGLTGYKDSYSKLKTYNNLSSLYYSLGRYDESIKLINELLEYIRSESSDSVQELLAALSNLSMAYLKSERFNLAKETIAELEEYLSDYSDTTSFIYSIHLNNLGIFYLEADEFGKAIELFNKAIEIASSFSTNKHSNLISLHNNIASAYFRSGDYEKSRVFIEKSLDIIVDNFGRDNYNYNNVLFNSALLQLLTGEKRKGTEIIISCIRQSILNINKTFDYLTESEQLQFIETERMKLDILFSLVKEKVIDYNELNGDIFNLWINFKGLIFSSTKRMYDFIRNSNDKTLVNLYESLSEKKKRHIALVRFNADPNPLQIDSLSFEIAKVEKEIINKINESTYKTEINPSWQSISSILGSREAAIEIIRAEYLYKDYKPDSSFYIFMVLKNNGKQPEFIIIDDGYYLEKKHYAAYQSIIEKKGGMHIEVEREKLSELFNNYWAEIDKQLDGIEKVYIANDGVYNTININTLFNPKSQKYILEEYDIYYISSTKDLLLESPKFTDKRDAFLLGDAEFYTAQTSELYAESKKSERERYFGSKINDLPGTKIEIDKIESILKQKKWDVNKIYGTDASEEALKNIKSPRILHIATHGVFFRNARKYNESNIFANTGKSQNPLYNSCLLLAGSGDYLNNPSIYQRKKEDGLLTAYEAMNMDLSSTEIVVLSACETALGEIRNGEGVFGLQRAIQVAGANEIIMSLWKVNDEATQELMTEFYVNWMSGMKKSSAFREAQINIKSKYPSIYFWGAFINLGKE